jgi:Spy/CpxP family protein refolding chaperone
MKLVLRLAMGIALVVCLATVAQAQPGGGRGGFGGGFGGGSNRLGLLRIEAVQKELGLTEDQIASIKKLSDELRPMGGRGAGGRPGGARPQGGEGQPRRGGRRGNTPDARLEGPERFFVQAQPGRGQLSDEERAKFREEAAARAKKEKEELAKILKPDQLKRLREIFIQQAGTGAIGDEEVASELGISAEQKEKLAKIREEQGAAMRELFTGGGDREANRTKMADLRKSTDEKVLAVLSEDQKKKFEDMKGKKFDMPENPGRGGRPGGARPNNNN